jgi:hypothetical protein
LALSSLRKRCKVAARLQSRRQRINCSGQQPPNVVLGLPHFVKLSPQRGQISEQRRPQLIVFLPGLPAIGLHETENFLQLAAHQSHITELFDDIATELGEPGRLPRR